MCREPGRAEVKWLTADAEAHVHRQQLMSRHSSPRVLCRDEMSWMKKTFALFLFFNTRNCCHTARRPLLRFFQCRRTMCKPVGCTDKRGWCVCARVTKWRTLTRLSPGALVCFVSTKDVLHLLVCALRCFFLVTWAQCRWKGLLHSGRDVCVLCGFTVGMSAALNPERRMVAATCSLP